jgi:K(+)-stimulated pyrophosphate-energized sodium pump
MTELIVVLAISTAGLAASGYLVRWVLARPLGEPPMNRVAATVQAASERFTRRQASTVGALAALVGGALFLAYGIRPAAGDVVPGFETGVWLAVSFATGSAGALLAGQLATSTSVRAAARVAAAAQSSADEALRAALRAGGAVSLAAGSISALGAAALVVAVLALHGAFGPGRAEALSLVPSTPWLVLGYAAGACFVALLSQLSGGTFAKAADVGADLGAREAGLEEDDADNPAVIANLVGDCAGESASRATLGFAIAAAEDLVLMLALSLVYRADVDVRSALALVALPLLSRAFGVLGAGFGTFVVRTDERESPSAAVGRGLVVAGVLHTVGLAGAIQWLLPERRIGLFAGGAIGIALGAAVVLLTHYSVLPRFRPTRDVADAARSGPSANVLSGLVSGIDATLVPALLACGAAAAAWSVGQAFGGPAGSLLGLAALGIGLSGTATFLGALEGSAAIVDAASGVVGMTIGRDRRDVRGRLLSLESPGAAYRSASRAILALGGPTAIPVAVSVLVDLARRPGAALADLGSPWPLAAGLAGGAFVAWLVSRSISGCLRCARRILEEVRRQLRDRTPQAAQPGRARASGKPAGPAPDYGPCVETASRFALRHMVAPGLLAVGAPLLCSLALRSASESDMGSAAAGSVASFIVGSTVVGSLGALLAAQAGGTWGNAKKYIVTGAHGGRLLVDETGARAENPTFHAAVVGDTVGDPLKDVAVPVALVLTRMLPVLALVLLPLFH